MIKLCGEKAKSWPHGACALGTTKKTYHMCIVSYIIRENLKRCENDFLIKILKG